MIKDLKWADGTPVNLIEHVLSKPEFGCNHFIDEETHELDMLELQDAIIEYYGGNGPPSKDPCFKIVDVADCKDVY